MMGRSGDGHPATVQLVRSAVMRFLLARLYRAEYEYRRAARLQAELLPAMPTGVECPRCRLRYVAKLVDGRDPWMLEACEYAATMQLLRECPDHPHTFDAVP